MLKPPGSSSRGSSSRYASSRRKTMESPTDQLRKLSKLPPNKRCADCQTKGPQCVNLTVGSFICLTCAGIQREINSKIKSLGHSTFSNDEVEMMKQTDNDKVNAAWLARYDPQNERNRMHRQPENNQNEKHLRTWIRRKYEDKHWYYSDGSGASASAALTSPSPRPNNQPQPTVVQIPSASNPPADFLGAFDAPSPVQATDTSNNNDGNWAAFGGSTQQKQQSNSDPFAQSPKQPPLQQNLSDFGSAGQQPPQGVFANFGGQQQAPQQQQPSQGGFANFNQQQNKPPPRHQQQQMPMVQHGGGFTANFNQQQQMLQPPQQLQQPQTQQVPQGESNQNFGNFNPQSQTTNGANSGQQPTVADNKNVMRQQQMIQPPQQLQQPQTQQVPQGQLNQNFGNFNSQNQTTNGANSGQQPTVADNKNVMGRQQQQPQGAKGNQQQQHQSQDPFGPPLLQGGIGLQQHLPQKPTMAPNGQQQQQSQCAFSNMPSPSQGTMGGQLQQSQNQVQASPVLAGEKEDPMDAFAHLSVDNDGKNNYDNKVTGRMEGSTMPSNQCGTDKAPIENKTNDNGIQYKENEIVCYKSNGNREKAQIVKKHFDDQLQPFYTVQIMGREKQTDCNHLEPLDPAFGKIEPILLALSAMQLKQVEIFLDSMVVNTNSASTHAIPNAVAQNSVAAPKTSDQVPPSIVSRSQSAMSHVSNFTQQTPSQLQMPNLAQQQPSAVFAATVPTPSPGLAMNGMMSPPSMMSGSGHNVVIQANNTAQMIQQPQVQGRLLEPNSVSQMMQPQMLVQMHGQIPAPQLMQQQQQPQMEQSLQQQPPQHQLQSQMSQIPPPSPQGNPFDVY